MATLLYTQQYILRWDIN